MPRKKTSEPARPVDDVPFVFPQEAHNILTNAQQGHITLSEMADTKASILMGATFVVFTLAIDHMTSNTPTLPLMILTVFSFLATILSVMALRPKILKPPTTIQPNTNIVFFGSFSGIPEEQYISHVVDIMRSEEATYRAMARDLYQNGQVLQRKKYRYLSYAYSSFLVGIVATFAVFLIEMAVEAIA